MPGQGRLVARDYTPAELAAQGATISLFGETTYHIHLNDRACWQSVPANGWNYHLGVYQVLKNGSPTAISAA